MGGEYHHVWRRRQIMQMDTERMGKERGGDTAREKKRGRERT